MESADAVTKPKAYVFAAAAICYCPLCCSFRAAAESAGLADKYLLTSAGKLS